MEGSAGAGGQMKGPSRRDFGPQQQQGGPMMRAPHPGAAAAAARAHAQAQAQGMMGPMVGPRGSASHPEQVCFLGAGGRGCVFQSLLCTILSRVGSRGSCCFLFLKTKHPSLEYVSLDICRCRSHLLPEYSCTQGLTEIHLKMPYISEQQYDDPRPRPLHVTHRPPKRRVNTCILTATTTGRTSSRAATADLRRT